MYAIKKGKFYVKDMKYGGKSSYTSNPNYAKKYDTEEDAKKNACGNETVIKLSLQYA